MFAKTGKFTALLMAALMVATPLTEVAVFADELETIPEEGVVTEEVLAEEPSEAGDVITEDDLIADDQAEVVDGSEEAINGLAEEADEDANMTETEDGSDDLYADTDAPVVDGTKGKVLRLASAGTGIEKNQHIYFGKYDTGEAKKYKYKDPDAGEKPYWRVLDPQKANDGEKGIFVMSESLWGNYPDNTYHGSIKFGGESVNPDQINRYDWQHSDAQKWCEDFYKNTFDDREKQSIKEFSKTKTDAPIAGGSLGAEGMTNGWGKCELNEKDRIFFLSVQELNSYIIKATKDEQQPWRKGYYVGADGYENWWLRSPCADSSGKCDVALVYNDGSIKPWLNTSQNTARPAFNIRIDNILFTSSADGGKGSTAAGERPLEKVKDGDVKDWKLTVKDEGRKFKANRTDSGNVKAGGSIKIHYQDSQTGFGEHVSAVICDPVGNILYYGRIVYAIAATKASGDVDLKIPVDISDGTYKVMVFNELILDDKSTDFASEASEFTIEVGKRVQTVTASDQTKRMGDAAFILNAKTDGDGKLSYESSDTNVVTVDKNGLVTIKGVGTANITITASETENYKAATKTVKITVTAKQKAEQKITASDQTKTVGDAPFDLKAKTSGDGKLSFKSGDKKVVTVDEDGYVTIIGTGTTTITITAAETANYKAATKVINIIIKAKVEPGKIDIGKAKITGVKSKTYTGKKIKQNPTVKLGGKTLKRGKDYAVKYTSDRVNAGKVTILINGRGDYTGSVLKTFKIKKAAITVKGKTVNVGASTIKGKGRTIKANKFFKISKNEGEVTYKKTKGLQKITVAKNGDVTLKPGIKKGPHEVKVKVTAAGDKNHKKTIKTVKITVMIK